MFLFKKKAILLTMLCLLVISISIITYVNSSSKRDTTVYNTVNLPANSITFSEIDKLDAFAELIVIGYAAEEFKDREHIITAFDDGALQSFHTNTNIKIEKILKKPGDFPSDQKELIIIEPVSLEGDVKYTLNDYVELQKDEPSVLFLMKNTYGDYGLINGNLGKFSLNGMSPNSSTPSSTSQELTEYTAFHDTVMKKYNLEQER